jgi:hypothetical protein
VLGAIAALSGIVTVCNVAGPLEGTILPKIVAYPARPGRPPSSTTKMELDDEGDSGNSLSMSPPAEKKKLTRNARA